MLHFLHVHDGQVDGFLDDHVIGELVLGLGVFSDSTDEVFDGIRCIDDLPYLEGVVKEAGQVIPVILP